jgi:hypothetical protein
MDRHGVRLRHPDWEVCAVNAHIPNRPRYAYVRNSRMIDSKPDRSHWDHALYDIVDNGMGSEEVLAYGVRFEPARLITEALNDYVKTH